MKDRFIPLLIIIILISGCTSDYDKLSSVQAVDCEDVILFTAFNEVDGHDSNLSETKEWLQEVLPIVKSEYSGNVCVQPTARAYYTGGEGYGVKLNYSGYDCITNFFSALTLEWGWDHNYEERSLFVNEMRRVFSEYDSIKYIMPTDVAVFYDDDWSEDTIICSYIRNNSTHPNESGGYDLFEFYFSEVYPFTNGSFLNNFKSFTWVNRTAGGIVREYYTSNDGVIGEEWSDTVWDTPGLLDLIEDAMMNDEDESVIFDWYTYTPGWARLDYEPSLENPGPFNCTSVEDCMHEYRSNPREYLDVSGECFD